MRSGTPLALVLGVIAGGCTDSIDAIYAAGKDVPPGTETTSGTTGTADASTVAATDSTAAETGTGEPSSDSSGLTSAASSSIADLGDATGEPLSPPSIVTIVLPAKIMTAGPMRVDVYTERAAIVEMTLDGALTFPLVNEGDSDGDGVDVFSGEVPIYGSPDSGSHTLTATARRDDLEDSLVRAFEVATPPAGSLAWETYGIGTRTARLAVTPDGALYEAGSYEINGLPRPALRLRDPVTGADLWPDGLRVLDAREGSIADVALATDGSVWVAMNVRQGNTWIARLAAFTADMDPTGAALEKPGATVQAIAADSAGGCFAVGFAVSNFGDSDTMVWRMTAAGVPILSGYPWDYVPEGSLPHTFNDLAFDVVADALSDEAWIVGGSFGPYDPNEQALESRGTILHVDIDTFEFLSPAFVAPPAGDIKQSMFYGAWLEPESLLVSGYQCDMMCQTQSVLATRYSLAGIPMWGYSSPPVKSAAGYSIASDTHGTVLIAASITEGTTTHGYLLGRKGMNEAFPPVAFPGKDTSNAASVVVGPYDWPFAAGNVTMYGESQGYVMHTHP